MGISSIWHWLVVLLIVVLFFGTGKLRNLGKDLGGAVHDFKKASKKARTAARKKPPPSRTNPTAAAKARPCSNSVSANCC